jgi:hypothetical protein
VTSGASRRVVTSCLFFISAVVVINSILEPG